MEKIPNSGCSVFFHRHLFQGALVLPHRAAYVFFENVVKIFVLTNAALPADLGDGQFSFPDNVVVAGIPAKVIGTFDTFLDHIK